MFTREFIESILDKVIVHLIDRLLPFMLLLFIACVTLRALIYFTLYMNEWFVREFEKRVDRYLDENPKGSLSFFVTAKKLLEKTFYEVFEIRGIMKRRKSDFIMPLSDRVFLVKQGAAWIVKDCLRQIRHLRRNENPNMIHISKGVLQRNPCFNKVFGLLPAAEFNSLLNILPSLFIVFGIFGTFMGITRALPDLSHMNLSNVEESKTVMDQFLLKTSFSMNASICGILFSVISSFFNAYFSPEKIFVRTVERYESILSLLWSRCDSNELPENISNFDENRDPIEALAEQSLERALTQKKTLLFGKKKAEADPDPMKKAS